MFIVARAVLIWTIHQIMAILFLPVLLVAASTWRRDTLKRRRNGDTPRLVYGPHPIVSIKYMSRAMQRLGYQAVTFVNTVYNINNRDDYDYSRMDFFRSPILHGKLGAALVRLCAPYLVLLWLLPRFDLFHFFFDGGFLCGTPLRYFEAQLLHLAGKKIVVMPYGSDVAVPRLTHSFLMRQGLLMNYPVLARREKAVLRQIDYFCRHADFVIACIYHGETLPRWDMLTTHYYPIDTQLWQTESTGSDADGVNEVVTVVHSPNHRGLKGTEFLITACNELKAEGYKIDLRLLERMPNSEVRNILSQSDILAEQFLVGYALSAMEGMALGKPVMSNIADDYYYLVHRLYTGLDECPVVSTPIDLIKENLRLLITNPQLRKQLGEAGRNYVLKYHSYAAVGRMWEMIYRKVWYGENIDLTIWHPDRYPIPSEKGQAFESEHRLAA